MCIYISMYISEEFLCNINSERVRGHDYCYATLIILFNINHLFASVAKTNNSTWFKVLLPNSTNSIGF